MVEQARRALSPGGKAIVLGPSQPALYNATDHNLGHLRLCTASGLRRLLKQTGLRPVEVILFNRVGSLAWTLHGTLFPNAPVTGAPLRLYDLLVPVARRTESLPLPGPTLIAVAEKR